MFKILTISPLPRAELLHEKIAPLDPTLFTMRIDSDPSRYDAILDRAVEVISTDENVVCVVVDGAYFLNVAMNYGGTMNEVMEHFHNELRARSERIIPLIVMNDFVIDDSESDLPDFYYSSWHLDANAVYDRLRTIVGPRRE